MRASAKFNLTISYNPGYQSVLKDLKQSTRQRFLTLEFDYPEAELERFIVIHESGVDEMHATLLVRFAKMTRNLKGSGLEEGASTRLLVHAAKLIVLGIDPLVACNATIVQTLTDDPDILTAIHELASTVF